MSTSAGNSLEIDHFKFHMGIACALAIISIASFIGCKLTSIHAHLGGRFLALVIVFAMVLPLPLYLHKTNRTKLLDGVLIILWLLLLLIIPPFPVFIAARSRMPLRDINLARIDEFLGVSVPHIMQWAKHHWLGSVFNHTYPLFVPLLAAAIFAPALAGRVKHARELLVAILTALFIGDLLFALFPAVGPWSAYHFAPAPNQLSCQNAFLAIRLPASYLYRASNEGIICFPSFHVIWAILSTAALWTFRPLRIPVALLSGMIILSTMTTGWHYFTDVLGGIVVASISIAFARACTRSLNVAYQETESAQQVQPAEVMM